MFLKCPVFKEKPMPSLLNQQNIQIHNDGTIPFPLERLIRASPLPEPELSQKSKPLHLIVGTFLAAWKYRFRGIFQVYLLLLEVYKLTSCLFKTGRCFFILGGSKRHNHV